jgi:hypothetical protein
MSKATYVDHMWLRHVSCLSNDWTLWNYPLRSALRAYCEVELIPLWEYDIAMHSITYVWYCEVELIPLWEYDTAMHSITYVWYCEVGLIPLWEYDTSTIWYVQHWWYDVHVPYSRERGTSRTSRESRLPLV